MGPPDKITWNNMAHTFNSSPLFGRRYWDQAFLVVGNFKKT